MTLSRDEFERARVDALAALPSQFRQFVANLGTEPWDHDAGVSYEAVLARTETIATDLLIALRAYNLWRLRPE